MSLATFDWTDRARPIVELGVGDTRIPSGSAAWDVARWDASPLSVWAGTEPSWHDITCDTMSYTCAYGRQRVTERFIVGTATVYVDNSTGWADPNVVADTNVLTVRPGRAIRMGVVHAVYGVRWLFRGFVDAMNPTYDPAEDDVVQLDCIDALGEVNRAKFVPQPLAPAGETVTARIGRLLDVGMWPTSKRDLSPTSDTLIADDMSGQLADLLGQAADSDGGVVFGDLEARIAYRPRDWQTYPPGTPHDGIIGNVDPGDVCPSKWERPFNRADIATRVIVGREQPPATGPAGPTGATGAQGPQGPTGPQGPPGTGGGSAGSGFTFNQESTPTATAVGNTWWQTSTGLSFVWSSDGTSSQWVQFAPGAPGAVGPQGPTGADSTVPGPTGPAGAKGDPGATGTTGAQGPQGVKGDTGTTGATGAAGTPGSTGAQGPKGDTGAQGIPGTAGTPGATGAQGPKGDPGTPGATGSTGVQGPKGDTGSTGVQGPQGDPGPTGPAGAAGSGYTFKQDTAPTPTAAGQTWWNSTTGALSGTTWVAVDRGGGVLVWVQDN